MTSLYNKAQKNWKNKQKEGARHEALEKSRPSDAQIAREIKSNAKRIRSNPNHSIMRMERAHSEGYHKD